MDIIFKTNKQMNFGEVTTGQVFRYGTNVYMKAYSHDGVDEAVDLSDGNAYTFSDTDRVTVVDTTLYVADYNA